jgi:hypothetical protein
LTWCAARAQRLRRCVVPLLRAGILCRYFVPLFRESARGGF